MSFNLLIDGDALVYKAGFAAESSYYVAYVDGEQRKFKTKGDALGVEGLVRIQDPKSFGIAKYCLEKLLESIRKATNSTHMTFCLTDSDINNNARKVLYPEYKGNRNAPKPVHYNNIRNYLISRYNAEVVTGIEADDWLGINQSSDTMIVSHDKDLLMVPGMHYSLTHNMVIKASDPGKLTLYDGNKLLGYGFKWFCAQMLLGDTSDNIPGIRGLGPIKTFKVLEKLETVAEMYDTVTKIYETKKREDQQLIEKLLWMQRFNLPTVQEYLEIAR